MCYLSKVLLRVRYSSRDGHYNTVQQQIYKYTHFAELKLGTFYLVSLRLPSPLAPTIPQFSLFFFLSTSMPYGRSWARDRTRAVAVTYIIATAAAGS